MEAKVRRQLVLLTLAGAVIGGIAAVLVRFGNPGNMGVCVACFVRDIAGTAGGSALNMAGVAYLRPEIPGILLGASVGALTSKEFRPRGGGSFALRFAFGFAFMMAALVFLGCTVRAWLRIGGGDLNAVVGVAGLIVGVAVGSAFLRSGYSLGRARDLPAPAGWLLPSVAVGLVVLAIAVAAGAKPSFLTVTAPAVPPGGRRAPLLLSLLGGLAVGLLAQRTRLCTTGGIRDVILWRRFDKLLGVLGLVGGALAVNLALGQFRLGFEGQPVAHTDVIANFGAMAVAGLAAVLMGGCPLRQLVMAGEGDADAGGALAGMLAGALVAHGAGLASTPRGPAPGALLALAVLAAALAAAGFVRRRTAPSAATASPQG